MVRVRVWNFEECKKCINICVQMVDTVSSRLKVWYTETSLSLMWLTLKEQLVSYSCLQDQIHSNHLNRMEQECAGLHEKVQYLTAQNKGLQTQLSETKRKHSESECKVRPTILCNLHMLFSSLLHMSVSETFSSVNKSCSSAERQVFQSCKTQFCYQKVILDLQELFYTTVNKSVLFRRQDLPIIL